MKYQNELELIAYKVSEIKDDLKALAHIEKRVATLERFMFMIYGASSFLVCGLPAIYFILKHFGN